MTRQNYAASHGILRLTTKRFETSPFMERYVNDNTVFGLYCRRLFPLTQGNDPEEGYWRLRQKVALFDVPEKPLEIFGPDAVTLLERVLTRSVRSLPLWRARYALACTPAGGIVMDGVLIRTAADHFIYVQADGEFELWLQAYAAGLDVQIRDPGSRVLQVQGPNAFHLMQAATAGEIAKDFRYFHAGRIHVGGQSMVISRTGWTGELGYELYTDGESTDALALWDHLLERGAEFDLAFCTADVMGIRRLEAGILDNRTDMDTSMTPFEAGLGAFVDFNQPEFVGRDALLSAHRGRLLFGLTCDAAVPLTGTRVLDGDKIVGQTTAGAWTPHLQKGIGYVRFDQHGDWLGKALKLVARDGEVYPCAVVDLPFYDAEKAIPRTIPNVARL